MTTGPFQRLLRRASPGGFDDEHASNETTATVEEAAEPRTRTGPPSEPTETTIDPDGALYDQAPPRWPWIIGLLLSLLGFGVSGYLTYEHYTGSTSLSCPAASTHGVVNCLKVTTSPWSVQNGIPVAVLGLVFFVIMFALQTPTAWRTSFFAIRAGRIAWCVVGIITALRLLYFELHDIQAICEWCTSVHVITFLLFISTLLGTACTATYPADDED